MSTIQELDQKVSKILSTFIILRQFKFMICPYNTLGFEYHDILIKEQIPRMHHGIDIYDFIYIYYNI